MAKENIYKSLEVFYEKVSECPLRDREFNFFEMVYVLSGKGTHGINGNRLDYHKGDLFLITPNDCHEFDLEGMCEFMVILFSEHYITNYQGDSIDHIECLLYASSHLSGSVIKHPGDQQTMEMLMTNLHRTLEENLMYVEDLRKHLVNAIIVIAARNLALVRPENLTANTDARIMEILNYIQENIRRPELLKIGVIAEKFSLSPTYLGSYFRKQCNEPLQQYTANYRLRLIEHRLRFSERRIHEIADEFGFTDESHINKFFRRYHGLSAAQFRKKHSSISNKL